MPTQTILVIDDEDLRDTIDVLLELEGFRAILAADGKAGLDQAILGKPALTLADLCLPDLRQKLEADHEWPRHFLTLHKTGYRFLP